jgi:hypothetical protein
MSRMTLSYKDYKRKVGTCDFLLPDITAGGADYDALVTAAAAMVAAIETLNVGILTKEQIAINEAVEVGDAAIGAKRQLGLRVFWADTTAETVGHFTIPSPDPEGAWLQVGTDIVDVNDSDIAALITAVNANVLSPDGNAVNVSRIVEVGRRT